jgi:hypothetical protein
MQLNAPIIIVGAGRSGSTLLDRMLDAHPDIHMLGETDFFVPELFNCLLRGRRKTLVGSDSVDYALRELARLGQLTCATVAELFELPESERNHWGIKEIWNGDKIAIDWTIYDLVFPLATWVHLIRNPLHCALSAIAWSERELTEEALTVQFQSWARMIDLSSERRSTGRYVEIRYEDLVEEPENSISQILEEVGLIYSPHCKVPLKERWVPSNVLLEMPNTGLVSKVIAGLGIEGKLKELGYRDLLSGSNRSDVICCAEPNLQEQAFFWLQYQFGMPLEDDSRSGNFMIMNSSRIESAGGKAFSYWAPLMVGDSDCLALPEQSRYVMMEDAIQVGPAHAHHETIREVGRGCWSHWGQFILFSSSDGTDPRTNGRKYALTRLSQESSVPGGLG